MTPPLPTLPSTEQLKSYLRIETDRENDLLKDLLARVQGDIEFSIGKPLNIQVGYVWYDDAVTQRIGEAVTNLMLAITPLDAATLVITAGDGSTVDATQYTVRQDLGLVVAVENFVFDAGPYTLTASVGFGTSPTYVTRELPAISSLMLDYAAFLYQQRTPGARSEGSSGTRIEYEVDDETGLPKRVAKGIRRLRGIVV